MFAFEMKQLVSVAETRETGIIVGRKEYIYTENQYDVRLYPPATVPEKRFAEGQLRPQFTQASVIGTNGRLPTKEFADVPELPGAKKPTEFAAMLEETRTSVP